MSSDTALDAIGADLYAHPVAAALLVEALTLLGDGVAAAEVESAAVDAGLPFGPLRILDAMSLEIVDHALHDELHALERRHDHGHHAHDHDHSHDHDHGQGHGHGHGHGHEHEHGNAPAPAESAHRHAHATKSKRMPESAVYVLEKMAHGYKRMGRAGGGGFYDYSSDPPALWSGLKTFARRGRQLDPADIRDRLVHAATIAAIGASAGTAPGPVTAVFGPGIPGDAAQARAQLRARGEAAFVARARELAGRFGPRFEPPASITGAA